MLPATSVHFLINDLPSQNRITIRDSDGNALAGASVMIYQSAPKAQEWYGKYFDNIPDLMLTADPQGQVLLGRNPFGSGPIVHTYEHSNGVIIVVCSTRDASRTVSLRCGASTLEYWRGLTAQGEYDLRVTLR